MISEKLVQLRTQKNLTQSALAKKVRINRVALIRYEKGVYNPTTDILARIAKVLGVEPEYFMTPDDPQVQIDNTLLLRKMKLVTKMSPKAKFAVWALMDALIESESKSVGIGK